MKKFKTVSDIMLIVAIVVFALSVIISIVTLNAAETLYLTYIQANALILCFSAVGAFMKYSKNETAKKVGNSLILAAFCVGLMCALMTISTLSAQTNSTKASNTKNEPQASIGAIIMIISVVLLLLHYIFLLVHYLLNRNSAISDDPNEDLRIKRIKEWKQILNEGIITEEEFEEKRIQILGLTVKNESDTTNNASEGN